GVRRRTRVVLQQRMYQDEIPGWLREADQQYQTLGHTTRNRESNSQLDATASTLNLCDSDQLQHRDSITETTSQDNYDVIVTASAQSTSNGNPFGTTDPPSSPGFPSFLNQSNNNASSC
ncbi:unnamed protein product, partial [Meganyctiphanes norvegica]